MKVELRKISEFLYYSKFTIMKTYLFISLLTLAACTSNTSEEKEKELLEKELELTKKELELAKRQNEVDPIEANKTMKTTQTKKQEDIESLVFSTGMLSNPKKVKINGKEYTITIKQEFLELDNGGPDEYTSTLIFSPNNIPNLKVGGQLGSFVVKDLNNDGQEEVIALTTGNSTWAFIETYRLSAKMKWVKPFESFMWWTMPEGCPAKMYWVSNKNQMRIITSKLGDKTIECNDIQNVNWK